MNKNILTKWIVGLTSVAAFMGFIGVIKNYDASKQALPEEPSTNAPVQDANQAIKQEWVNSAQQLSPAPAADVQHENQFIRVYQRQEEDEYEEHRHKSRKHHEDEHEKNEHHYSAIPQSTGTVDNSIPSANTNGSPSISSIPTVNQPAANRIRTRAS